MTHTTDTLERDPTAEVGSSQETPAGSSAATLEPAAAADAVEAAAGVPAAAEDAAPIGAEEAIDALERSLRRFTALLQADAPDAAWVAELTTELAAYRAFCDRCPDTTIYYLIYHCAHETHHYSVPHAMLCAAITHLATKWLEWPAAERDALVAAALTMNIAMTALQDALASHITNLDSSHREAIEQHAARGRQILEEAGVKDALWLRVVASHHAQAGSQEFERLPVDARLAELLRRVDVYTAKLSRRKRRAASTPALAARDAFLDAAGGPDVLGATLLRVLGLYPPGSWVELRNGDIGLVIARGEKAHAPIVAAVRRADGGLFMNPVRRDTSLRTWAIVRGVGGHDARVRVSHIKVLGA